MERLLGLVIGSVVAFVVMNVTSAAVSLPLWAAWRYGIVPVFHTPEISFLQMWFLVGGFLVARLIFFPRSK